MKQELNELNQLNELTKNVIGSIIDQSKYLAEKASIDYAEVNLDDQLSCGFAWLDFQTFNGKKIRSNSQIGKIFKELGIERHIDSTTYTIWNPSGHPTQNMYVKIAGVEAAIKLLESFSFGCTSHSRLD